MPLSKSTALALVLLAMSRATGQPAEWDAKFVRTDAPKTVTADQVFAVKITMKNAGTQAWKEARDIVPPSLRSQEPDNNETWGTAFILQSQGTTVAPGQEVTYTSNLRAPTEAGKYAFQWRVSGPQGFFGQPTTRLEIVVEKREEQFKPKVVPGPDPGGKRPLMFDDFEYLGSFRVPESVGKGGAGFSECGLALRTTKGGAKRLLLNYTHPEGSLFEVEVPELVKFEKGDARPLKTAAAKTTWGAIVGKNPKATANGGFVWDDAKKLLYWSYYHSYWAGDDLPVLNATRLEEDGTSAAVGSWTVPRQKWHWGGVTRLPKSFADKYTGGETLAVGFGGYFSIVAPCSRGPALSAVADPDPAKQRVDKLVNLLGYPDGSAAPRPGDFFNANCTFWHDQPKSRASGMWSFTDYCRAGVLIDLPTKQGYVAFVKLGTGRLGYDNGHITNAGEAQFWYFYDTRQLGETAKGTHKIGTATPYLMRPDPGTGGLATGACFDEAERKLYVLRASAYPHGREFHPLVHVYRVAP